MPIAMLTKSLVLEGVQCPKRLWLTLNASDEGEGQTESPQMTLGRVAGRIAQQRWPQGRQIPPGPLAAVTRYTASELTYPAPARALFEAAFIHGDVGIRADALVRAGRGRWDLVEVKTSTTQKPEHVDDCAIQAWVIENTGLKLRRICLALIDKEFVYRGDNDYRNLFRLEDLSKTVRSRTADVPSIIRRLRQVAKGDMPSTPMGSHCQKPWPCPFQDFCSAGAPDFPVGLLPGKRGKNLAAELEQQGYADLREVPLELIKDPLLRRIIHATRSEQAFLSDEARAAVPSDEFPRYYLDFETAAFPVPIWSGTSPYQKIPFQWSCHVEPSPGKAKHISFLQLGEDDPSESCARQLIEVLGRKGPIFTYGHFDRGIVNSLANRFPRLSTQLTAISERIVDVLPLVKAHYYHPEMAGSFSIKYVAPTIAPQYGYDSLDGVSEGNDAQMACWRIVTGEIEAGEVDAVSRQLEQYCALDTRALMAVVHHLERRS